MAILAALLFAALLPVGALLGLAYAVCGVGGVIMAILIMIRKIFCE